MRKNLIIPLVIFIALVIVVAFLLIKNIYQSPSGNKANLSGYEIQIESFAFSPSQIMIKAGSTVTWKNMDPTPHTITSDAGNELNSPVLVTGSSYSHTFKNPGIYSYHCSINPIMTGKIIVH